MKVALVVPVKNGGSKWLNVINAIHMQSLHPDRILIIDSGSTDGSDLAAVDAGFDVIAIAPKSFNHGGTRQYAVNLLADCDVIIFLTQDAIPANGDSFNNIVKALLEHPDAGVAYGRHLPREDADPIERHARLFNFPEQSREKSLANLQEMGIKTAYSSDSFAAYRRDILLRSGGFPEKIVSGEDMVVAANIMLHGGTVVYAADACVIHSHSYGLLEEAKRYYDTGRMHNDQRALLSRFRPPESEGKRFVLSEMDFLWKQAPYCIPSAMLRTLTKYTAYRLGKANIGTGKNNGKIS